MREKLINMLVNKHTWLDLVSAGSVHLLKKVYV